MEFGICVYDARIIRCRKKKSIKMVYNGEIDAKTKALVKFLKEDSFLTVKEITKRCKVSRATVYRCLNPSEIKEKRKPSGNPAKYLQETKSDSKKHWKTAQNRR